LSDISTEDIERLASRLAMMASEEGEAANAGRAVAQLARRLGLTGGALKEMFLQGAMPTPGRPVVAPVAAAETDRLERELSILRKSVRLLEANYRDLEGERDGLARELDAMRSRTASARSRSRISLLLVGVVMLAMTGGGVVGWLVSTGEFDRSRPAVPMPGAQGSFVVPGTDPAALNAAATADFGPVLRRVGIIRAAQAVARRAPDEASPAVATLLQGAPVVVRRVFGPARGRWAEVEVGSSIGYVWAAEIDLS
jgi:hypothetical protein